MKKKEENLSWWNDKTHVLSISMVAIVAIFSVVLLSTNDNRVGEAYTVPSSPAIGDSEETPSAGGDGSDVINAHECSQDEFCETNGLKIQDTYLVQDNFNNLIISSQPNTYIGIVRDLILSGALSVQGTIESNAMAGNGKQYVCVDNGGTLYASKSPCTS